MFFVYKSGDNFIFELNKATVKRRSINSISRIHCDSEVGADVALCIVTTDFTGKITFFG